MKTTKQIIVSQTISGDIAETAESLRAILDHLTAKLKWQLDHLTAKLKWQRGNYVKLGEPEFVIDPYEDAVYVENENGVGEWKGSKVKISLIQAVIVDTEIKNKIN